MQKRYLVLIGVAIIIIAAVIGTVYYFEVMAPKTSSITAVFNVTSPITVGTPFSITANLSGYVEGVPMNGTSANITVYWSTDNVTWTQLGVLQVPGAGGEVSINAPALGTGTYFFVANYSGNSRYIEATSGSELITVNRASSATVTQLNATSIALGASVADTANVTFLAPIGPYPVPTGSVTFQYRMGTGGAWQPLATASTAWDATNQRYVAVSATFTPTQSGTYQFNASYSGDGNYTGSWPSTVTTLETVDVGVATPSITTSLNATNIFLSRSVYDTATVTGLGGSYPAPTGSVQFQNNDTGSWVTFDTESLIGGTATSAPFTPSHLGTFYFRAVYSGDGNYSSVTSNPSTEVLTVSFQSFVVSGYVFNLEGGVLANWTIDLFSTTSLAATNMTNSQGYYSFAINQTGLYTINETVQANWTRISPANDYTFNATSGHAPITGMNFTNFEYLVPLSGGISGTPWLAGLNLSTNNTGNIASSSINVIAGTLNVTAVDGATVTNEGLVIIFAYNGTSLVTFSGAQFDLYLSQNGFASIGAGDIPYATGFNITSFGSPFPTAIQINNPFLPNGEATFYQGNGTLNGWPAEMLMGPISYNITQNYKYIKVYEGGVVVALQMINVQPLLILTPSVGPAHTPVTISGNVNLPNTEYNLSYGGSSTAFAQVMTDGNGAFSYTFNIEDTGADWAVHQSTNIEIDLINTATSSLVNKVFFNEPSRVFLMLANNSGSFGNNTGPYGVHPLSAYTFIGNNFMPSSNLTFTIDNSITLGSAMTNSTGYFNVTFTIPALNNGNHNFTVSDDAYTAKLGVLQTLILTPSQGPVGSFVTIQTFGFMPGPIYLYFDKLFSNSTYSFNWLLNSSIGSNGQINGTDVFKVPPMSGGAHTLYVDYAFDGNGTNVLSELNGTGTFTQ